MGSAAIAAIVAVTRKKQMITNNKGLQVDYQTNRHASLEPVDNGDIFVFAKCKFFKR